MTLSLVLEQSWGVLERFLVWRREDKRDSQTAALITYGKMLGGHRILLILDP